MVARRLHRLFPERLAPPAAAGHRAASASARLLRSAPIPVCAGPGELASVAAERPDQELADALAQLRRRLGEDAALGGRQMLGGVAVWAGDVSLEHLAPRPA